MGAVISALSTLKSTEYSFSIPDWLASLFFLSVVLSITFYFGVIVYRFVRSFKKEESDGR